MFSYNVVFNSLCYIILMFLCNKPGFVKSANETICSEQPSLRPYDDSCNQSSECITNSSDIVCVCPVNTHYNNYTASCVLDCNAAATNHSGQIVSPNYPSLYPDYNLCTWTLTGTSNSYYVFSISDMDIENSDNCVYDSLKIYDGTNGTQLATFCNRRQTTINVVASTTNSMNIVFMTDGSVEGKGFSGAYRIFDYNTTITEPRNGYIASPGYPLQYPSNSYFSWTIRGSPGTFISLSIYDMGIENSPNCTYNSLKIYDGPDGTQLATFCNIDQTPMNLVASTTNSMHIVFKTDGNVEGKGFSGAYQILDYNSTLTYAQNGYIVSPGYPLKIQANSYFSWTIRGRPGSFISFSFTDMDIENSPNCTYDSLKIYDGTTGTQLATFCNRSQTTINVVASTTNSMHIVFKTNGNVEGKGFSGAYQIFDYNTDIIEPQNGYIASPGYPMQYPASSYFSWTIRGKPGTFISLRIMNLTLESAVSCSYDYVQVYDGINSDATILNQICSNKDDQRVFTSTGSSIHVVFRSDSSIEKPGFLANYEINECQTILTYESGEIVSPGYPLNYVENLRCSWTIITDPDKRIALRIKEMYLNDNNDCIFDNLRIYDGENMNYRDLGTFCYLQSSYTIVSTSNILIMLLETDGMLNYKGFSATYNTSDVGDTSPCDPEVESTCGSDLYFECRPDKQGVFRCLCTSGMYSNGSRCLSDSQLSVVLNSYPQILTKNVTFIWTSSTLTQLVAYNITWVATEDSSDNGEMVARPSGVSVLGLTPGTEYNFTVLSILQGNDCYDDSVFPTHFTFETRPAPTGKLNERSSNLHNIPYVLRFGPSEGRVARYNITVGAKSYEVFNSELTIKDLTPDTQYGYTITAYNKHGVGSEEVAGLFKTDPESTFKQEKVSLNVTLIAGVTAAAVFVAIIAVAVVVTQVVRKRRVNSKPPASEIIEYIDDDEIVRGLPIAPTPSPRAVMNRYMTIAGLRAKADTDQIDGRENDCVTNSQIGAWHEVTNQNLQTTNNAGNIVKPDVENVYNNDVILNEQDAEHVYDNNVNINVHDVENVYNNATYVAS